jgi:MFS family permease
VADRAILYATAFARSLATGMLGVVLGLFLAGLGFTPAAIGAVVAAGLAGGAVAALFVTLGGDRIGRRRVLVGLALVGAAGALSATLVTSPMAMGLVAFLGMLNGMGRDRGAAFILDQAILPVTTTARDRTLRFAWYNVVQDAGHAGGALLAALPALLRRDLGFGEPASMRTLLVIYAVLLGSTAALYSRLSSGVEQPLEARRTAVSPETRRVLWKISSLFAVDSIAGGFLTTSLIAYFFFKRFDASEGSIAILFFCARVANAGSHLGAAWLARRIGLVNTMVLTHIPSSLLLLTVPFAPNFWWAALLFLLREGLVEMDVPTRQSYVMAVARPEERTTASGVTNIVRLAGWALAPSLAGTLMGGTALGAPLVIGASLKISYDILLYGAFRRLSPPEERS